MIDLRSDTVTKPTPEMRRAMAEAEVGDDVYGEDPTVNRLQERAAEIFEKEAAIFVPTGSMGNQAAVKIHTRPGQEVIIEERGHIYNFEMATMSSFAGVLARPVKSTDGSGILTWDEIAGALHHNTAYYVAPTGLIALENSHNLAGGSLLTRERAEDICTRAHENNLPVHLDGARIFNAATALNESVQDAVDLTTRRGRDVDPDVGSATGSPRSPSAPTPSVARSPAFSVPRFRRSTSPSIRP